MDDWRENLPESLQENEQLKRFENVEELARSFVETRNKLTSTFRLPTKAADDEARVEVFGKVKEHYPEMILLPDPEKPFAEQSSEFKASFGIPETATEYALPEDLGGMNEEVVTNVTKWAHELGLNRDQTKGFLSKMGEQHKAMVTDMSESATKAENTLKALLADDYDNTRNAIGELVIQFQNEDHPIGVDSPEFDMLTSNPAVTLLLANVLRDAIGEGEKLSDFIGERKNAPTLEDLEYELSDLERSEEGVNFRGGKLSRADGSRYLEKTFKLKDRITELKERLGA